MNVPLVVVRVTMPQYDDRARWLRCEDEQERRKKMLSSPHVAPLCEYVKELRKEYGDGWYLPDFDPLDGGVEAQILFLFEKPGRMTDPNGKQTGSGFISRNNNDPTAEHTFAFMNFAGLGGKNRRLTCIWNVAPAWNGTTVVRDSETQKVAAHLSGLLSLLPHLKAVVFVGAVAANRGEAMVREHRPDLITIRSLHPSPKVKNKNPEKWSSIWREWQKAKMLLQA
jgi:hypothetical protein